MRNLTWINGHALIEGLEDGALSVVNLERRKSIIYFFNLKSVFVFIVMQSRSLALAGTKRQTPIFGLTRYQM
jgi:hypothetical protein